MISDYLKPYSNHIKALSHGELCVECESISKSLDKHEISEEDIEKGLILMKELELRMSASNKKA